jgi:hypothetical protein
VRGREKEKESGRKNGKGGRETVVIGTGTVGIEIGTEIGTGIETRIGIVGTETVGIETEIGTEIGTGTGIEIENATMINHGIHIILYYHSILLFFISFLMIIIVFVK